MLQRIAVIIALFLATTGCGWGDDDPEGGARTPAPLPSTAAQPDGKIGKPKELTGGLAVPWAVAFLPGGDALVTERESARLLRVTPEGEATEVGKVPGVEAEGEGGLMGVAVSPSFDTDRLVFLLFTARSDNRVVRFRYPASGKGIGALEPLVTKIPKGSNHNGGRLAFGPDKMLYATTGETGSKPQLSQDRDSLGGKILRMTLNGKPAPGNPFRGSLVWSYGHRNVQGIAWDSARRMYATEFGQDRFDEINRIEKGRNYGWPDVEGFGKRHTRPELTWTTAEASPSGMAFARGSLWVAALRGQRLWQVPLGRDGATGRPIAHFEKRYGRLRAAATAPGGSLWITTSNRDGRGSVRTGDDKILVIAMR